MPRRLTKALVQAATVIVAAGAGLALAEGLLRLIVPVEVRYETWFTPGIHTYEEELGFVCTPGYAGQMRHLDKLYRGVPLELNEHGMRLENRSPAAGEGSPRIVALGGRSMLMSYGLEDDASITGVLAQKLEQPTIIQNTSWPGWGLWMNWLSYRRLLDDEDPFDLAIVAVYNEDYASFEQWDSYEWNWPQPAEEVIFAQLPGVRLWPEGLIAKFGKWPYRSYLLYGVLRAIDGMANTETEPAPAAPDIPTNGFVRYLDYIRQHFARQGTETLIVFLPQKDQPVELYDVLARNMPPDFYWVDLHKELHGEMDTLGWIGMHHYSGAAAAKVADAMEQYVGNALQGRPR